MRGKALLFAVLGLAVVGVLGAALFVSQKGPQVSSTTPFSVPNSDPMTVDMAHQSFYKMAPALLLVVYDAFGKTQEDDIYDTLAQVSHGEALEYLYLERVGAMAGGGLEEEADQKIHEIKLLKANAERDEATLTIDASWQVIGTVGHAEHMHVRGNTYSADLTVSPIEGAWRITDFKLLDVNRDAAGQTFEVPKAKDEDSKAKE